ncbi:sensor histidine kinase [Paenibacillus massiliensis]|uniref:sensor histidine kinase n=1 Tax=Paenibacillus massiliensis TaxID=225917 RepID=UPI00041B508F|nr:sensor histidine kinase [Paenibacillus massiliensis]
MSRWINSLNTLRNQIFLGFMLVMVIVLIFIGMIVYKQVSVLLRNSAERHIQQTSMQTMGRLEAMLNQVNTLTAQVSTNATVQRLLMQEAEGSPLSFENRQQLQREVSKYEAYATDIKSLEIYTGNYRRLLPLDDGSLVDRLPPDWIQQADAGKGQLVWFGEDPVDASAVVAVRRIRLVEKSFTHGGYLYIRLDKAYFTLTDAASSFSTVTREGIWLYDQGGHVLSANSASAADAADVFAAEQDQGTLQLGKEHYVAVHNELEPTGWRLIMLTPVNYTTEWVPVLRQSILLSAMIGAVLFLILSFILTTMLIRPIRYLIRGMRGIGSGTMNPIPLSSRTVEIRELSLSYNQMVDSLNELIQVVYQKEILQSRTELKALQAQIHPHFLFNTMEALCWELDERGEEELARIVVAMSGLFRYVIHRREGDEWVQLREELEHVERYLVIMNMRLMHRLSWSMEVDEASQRLLIPKLLIQPIVENAIWHGVEQRLEPGQVVVRAIPAQRPGHTLISVTDNGPGMSRDKVKELYASFSAGHTESNKRSGVGLANVERRLRLFFENCGPCLRIESEPGHGTTISFEIPDHAGGSRRGEAI